VGLLSVANQSYSTGTASSANGAVTLTGSSRVNGDAETGPGGTVAMGWSCVVTGNITGSSRISYDESIAGGGGASGSGDYILQYWREI
jgi:hypothetical protein